MENDGREHGRAWDNLLYARSGLEKSNCVFLQALRLIFFKADESLHYFFNNRAL